MAPREHCGRCNRASTGERLPPPKKALTNWGTSSGNTLPLPAGLLRMRRKFLLPREFRMKFENW